VTIYCKKITAEQREWLKQYESEPGFEPMYQEDIDNGKKTFYEAAHANVLWYESHTSEVHQSIQRNIPGEDEALEGR
jgi:hypothetical protein